MWRMIFGLFMIPALVVEGGLIFEHASLSRWAWVNCLLYPLLGFVSIALHEGGHALAGRLVGLQIPRVQIGLGRRLARWRWGATRVDLHAFPVLGTTFPSADRAHGLRWRLWLTILAGPLATWGIVVLALRLGGLSLSQVLFPGRAMAETFAPFDSLGFANFWLLVINLLPRRPRRAGMTNDGTHLLFLPFRQQRLINEALVAGAIVEAYELTGASDQDRAQALLEAALRRFPGSWTARNSLAVVQLRRGQLVEARTNFLALLDEPLEPSMNTILRNNVAWTDFLLRDPALRDEADRYSAVALAKLKRPAAILGTRGAVLFWLGRCNEALPLLERAHLLEGLPGNRACTASVLAMAHAALRHPDDAARWLERAASNDPDCPLLAEARTAVNGLPAATAPVQASG